MLPPYPSSSASPNLPTASSANTPHAPAPVALRPTPIDSLVVLGRRAERQLAARNNRDRLEAVPEARIVAAATQAAVAAPPLEVFLPPRVPVFVPTVQAHQAIPAVGERQEQTNFVRMMRRVTLTETKYTPEEKADKIIDWLVVNGFMIRASETGRASQRPSKFYNHDTVNSKLFDGHGVSMATNMPWLKKEHIAAVRAILIDRVHAVKADPTAVSATTRACLIRYFTSLRDKKPLVPIANVTAPKSDQPLMRLSAFHTDDVYFDPHNSLDSGGQGSFFVGITRKGYPMGVKRIDKGGTHEAKVMRKLAVGGYIQAHFGSAAGRNVTAPTWLVMPCYGGTLWDVEAQFLAVPSRPRAAHSGGLIGARYVLHHLATECAYLHEQMRGVHTDIKPSNIFVAPAQRRFALGDYGFSGHMSASGDVRSMGRTLGLGSPEQEMGSKKIYSPSDVWSLCLVIINGLLRTDPAIKQTWRELHGKAVRPKMLFPSDETTVGEAYSAWFKFNEGHKPAVAVFEDVTQEARNTSPITLFEADFRRLNAVMGKLDPSLWHTLRAGLRKAPQERPTMLDIMNKTRLSEPDQAQCEAVWAQIPPYKQNIGGEIKRLKALFSLP